MMIKKFRVVLFFQYSKYRPFFLDNFKTIQLVFNLKLVKHSFFQFVLQITLIFIMLVDHPLHHNIPPLLLINFPPLLIIFLIYLKSLPFLLVM